MHKLTEFATISVDGVKGLMLDLDDTLYNYEHCNKVAFSDCANAAFTITGTPITQFTEAWKFGRSIVHRDVMNQGSSHSRLLYAHKALERLFGKSMPVEALKLETIFWDSFINAMKLDPEAEKFLIRANNASIKICIVTDLTAAIQTRKWEKLNLGRYCQFLVTSEEAGVEKPDKRIFQLALNKLGLTEKQVIMVGDNYEKDILGAEKINITAYLVKAGQININKN